MDMPFNLENRFDSVEMSDVAQLRELQLDRMRWSLTHAYNNVPFYRKSFDDAGVSQLSQVARNPRNVHSATTGKLSDGLHFPARGQATKKHEPVFITQGLEELCV